MKIGDIKSYIIDSSVLIKWLAKESEDLEEAQKLEADFTSGKVELFIPGLTAWELGNFLGRHFPHETAVTLYSIFQNYAFTQLILTPVASFLALDIMSKHKGVSFYDASCHALAIHYGASFITADKKYYEKNKALKHIQLLKDYV